MRAMLTQRNVFRLHHILLLSISLLQGCTSLSYYSQSVRGQMEIFANRQAINQVLENRQTGEALRQKLVLIKKILNFAETQLRLNAHGSYRDYVDLERPYVIWNIFATPELSLQAVQWCYLVVGCLSYRGYFDKQQALEFAGELKAKGLDVYLGGVSAYSTLGWFRDPIINTMLNRAEHELARLLFHELAHQKLYIKNDTDFNEAFADAVAIIGTERWLSTQQASLQKSIRLEQERERQFTALVLSTRERLMSLYAAKVPEEEKRQQKKRSIAELRNAYFQLRSSWGDYNVYDRWMNTDINNAKLSAVATYQNLVPDFLAVYNKLNEDLDMFYTLIAKLGECDKATRHELLSSHAISNNCPSQATKNAG